MTIVIMSYDTHVIYCGHHVVMSHVTANSVCIPLLCRLLDILEEIVPYKHFHKLRQFVNLKLPQGFPVKLGTYTSTCTHGYGSPFERGRERERVSFFLY